METLHSQLLRAAPHSAPQTRPGWPRTRLLWWSSGSSFELLLTWWFRSKPNPLDPRSGVKIIRFTALELSQKENFSVFGSNLENFYPSPEPRHPPASACTVNIPVAQNPDCCCFWCCFRIFNNSTRSDSSQCDLIRSQIVSVTSKCSGPQKSSCFPSFL